MRTGQRGKLHKVPHFKVKCHRSRSNLDRKFNDQYLVGDFDVIVTTPLNAMYQGNTLGEEFELVSEAGVLEILFDYYKVTDKEALIEAAAQDWRFALPEAIAEERDGYQLIPRTPYVWLANDANWRPLDQIQSHLEAIVKAKSQARRN